VSKQPVRSARVAQRFEPFSAAVSTGQLVFVAGQLPVAPDGAPGGGGSAAEQARRCLDNLRHQLRSIGLSLDTVVKLTVFALDAEAAAAVDDVAAEYFAPPRPARTVAGVAWLPHGARLQIEAVALRY
jgi:2-iminobutanoate/2-iminopropanoate deaminase